MDRVQTLSVTLNDISQDEKNHGLLFASCSSGSLQVLETLLEALPDIDFNFEYDEQSPFIVACLNSREEVVKRLLNKPINFRKKTKDRKSVLEFISPELRNLIQENDTGFDLFFFYLTFFFLNSKTRKKKKKKKKEENRWKYIETLIKKEEVIIENESLSQNHFQKLMGALKDGKIKKLL